MKVYPAAACIRAAAAAGLIAPGAPVVESSSGTMAIGLAQVCRLGGYRLIIVSDSACDPLAQMRLRELGARVEIILKPSESGGFQRARLDRVAEICAEEPGSWWVNQYDNPSNARGYVPFARQLTESLGAIDYLVGTVGSGGSVCGTAAALRADCPQLTVVGVDTFGSVLFGQPDGPRTLRGLGNSLLPQNLDHTIFDEVHWVTAAEAFTATRLLHHQTGLFRGPTSGACWLVARHLALREPDARVVCIFPDDGHRYGDSVYDDAFLTAHRLRLERLPSQPLEVTEPLAAGPSWSFLRWQRRSFHAVTGRRASTLWARRTTTNV